MRRLNAPPKPIKALLKITSILAVAVLLAAGTFVHHGAAATPTFKQAKANEIGSGSSNSVTFTSANTAGNLIVVYLIWNNTNTVSLSDSRGNAYAVATTRTTWGSNYSTQAFYAKNIAAGTNTVKATFATSINSFAIVQAHEYAGLDQTNPLDSWVGGSGSGTAMNSGSLTTTAANDLLFAGSGSVGAVSAIGSTYTGRLTTSGNRTMDKTAVTAGSYNATGTNSGGGWTLQLVAFKAASTADTTVPTAPGSVTATPASTSQVNLSWTAATDNVGVTGYKVERCQGAGCTSFTALATVSGTAYSDTGLNAATTYNYRVKATDAAGNVSTYSNTATATTPANPDAVAPTVPVNATVNSATETQVNLSWDASTDNVGVAGYKVYRNNTQITTSATTSYQDTGLSPNTSYSYTVSSYDAAGNESAQSAPVAANTLPDTTAPGVPNTVTAQANSSTQATVSWVASTDNIAVAGYKVFRDGTQITTVNTTTYQDTTLAANTAYTYTVSAYDAAGNESAQSSTANVTTPSTPAQATCPLPAYPNTSCTGVPSGTALTTVNGDYTAATAGEVIDGKHITGDLVINANNVIVKNSQVDGSVDNQNGSAHYAFTIADTTVGPATGCISYPGIGESDFTAARVLIRGHDDGFRMGGSNITITDSYAKLCWNPPSVAPPDGSHSDGIQNYCGGACTNLVFNHNTMDAQTVTSSGGDARTVYLGGNADGAGIASISVNDNLLRGGGYTMFMQYRGGSKWVVHNNRVVNNSWQYAAVTAENTCVNQDWSGNSLVTIDSNYAVTGTVATLGCIE